MPDAAVSATPPRIGGPIARLVSRPGFQAWAARFPLTRRFARRDGIELFRLVQGFVESQALSALVRLDVLERLGERPTTAANLAAAVDVPADRMQILMQAGAAMGLLRRRRDGSFALARRGAALLGVPGLRQMILHHDAFYRDLGDPVALLRGTVDTELEAFWPYVFGASGAVDPEVTATYSRLMSDSQALVAADTLAMVRLDGTQRLMDVGGGTGAFLAAAAARYPGIQGTLFDLPPLRETAEARFFRAGLSDRVRFVGGSFRDDAMPSGADTISLVRVLYDHSDPTVQALLAAAYKVLPAGGRLIVSEPMSGGTSPDPVTDVYFAFYTLAMGTGRTRSAIRIGELCAAAGFNDIRTPRPPRSFVTSVLTCVKPG